MSPSNGLCLIIAVFQQWHCISGVDIYQVDDAQGLGRRFDGIGGLSGGGVRKFLTVHPWHIHDSAIR